MKHLYKSFEIKAAEEGGSITGYFSTYDRIPDAYGDVIAKGAFTETIKAREASGHPFPLCWNHDLDQIIGKVESIQDTEKGPLMTASFFDTPLAQEKRAIVKSGVVYQFSFAYDVLEAGPVELSDGVKANELRKLDLFEVSIVPIPANPRAVATEIKGAEPETKETEPEEKSGRRNSAADEAAIRGAIEALQRVLGEFDDADEDKTEEEPTEDNAAAEDPKDANPEKSSLLEYIKNMEVECNEHED